MMDDIKAAYLAAEDIPQSNDRSIVTITADLAATFTFASHQNSIPVIRSIRVDNLTTDSLENTRLELTSSPPFLRAKTWTIDRIIAGEGVALSDRRIDLDTACRRIGRGRTWRYSAKAVPGRSYDR